MHSSRRFGCRFAPLAALPFAAPARAILLVTAVTLAIRPAAGADRPVTIAAVVTAPARTVTIATVTTASAHAIASVPVDTAGIARALDRAASWLDTLSVDCATLRAHGVKGRKKLAEILDAELELSRDRPTERARIDARVRALTAQTLEPEYHDLAHVSEQELREDGMSYLRVAWLMDSLGLDTRDYRRAITTELPRLEAQLASRGVWQRAEFERYFMAFGFDPVAPIAPAALAGGVIARRLALDAYDLDRAYDLTHEVFLRCEDPAGMPARWGSGDLAYLGRTLPELARRALARGSLDIEAELLTALVETGGGGDPVVDEGVRALITAQNPDGSWGSYQRDRVRYGTWVEQREYLHTTMVAIEALVAADLGARVPSGAAPEASARP